MLPNLAQGAAQGMEDAFVLAQLLSGVRGVPDIEAALAGFYERRHARVKRVQEGARWNLEFFHQPDGFVTGMRDGMMRLAGPLTTRLIARKYHWLYRQSG
jgi:salicylate hydroxylase